MQLTWYGHSCFLLTDNAGTRILTDPCDPSVGYTLSCVACDIVTVSHGHHDHNYVEAAAGSPAVIDTEGAHTVNGVPVTGYASWHDEAQGSKRGGNLMFLMELDGVRVLHLGDLGHMLSKETIAAFGRVDVLLCPVGGNYTIDAPEAKRIATAIDPAIFIPMHYATPVSTIRIAGLAPMLQLVGKERTVHRLNGSACTITADALNEKRILILDYQR